MKHLYPFSIHIEMEQQKDSIEFFRIETRPKFYKIMDETFGKFALDEYQYSVECLKDLDIIETNRL